MIGRVLTLLMCGVIGGCAANVTGPGSPPTPLPRQPACQAAGEPNALCILVLGDSIASGVPLAGNERWWVRLQSLLGAALPDRRVVVDSWAVPGSRVDVLESAARDQPAIDSYDVALVIEGVNDVGALTLDAWLARYKAAIADIEGHGLLVVVGTPPPNFGEGAFGSVYDRTAAAIRSLATGRRPVMDIAERWRADGPAIAATYYADLIHQNAVGQQVMAQMASDVIRGAIDAR